MEPVPSLGLGDLALFALSVGLSLSCSSQRRSHSSTFTNSVTSSSSSSSSSSTSSPSSSLKGEKIFLTIDVGSSSIRCCAYRVDTCSGQPVALQDCSATHSDCTVSNGTADCDQVFDRVNHVVKTCLGMLQHQGADTVHSVGITTFAMALVGVDVKSGEPVTPVFTYAGQGSKVNSVADEIISELPERYRKEHQARTGTVLHHPCYATAQLKNFFRINQNTTSSHVALSSIRWTTLGGYVLGRWTGLGHRLPVSLSDAAWTGLLDIHTHQWDSISLGYLGLENDAFAPIAESSTPQTMRLDVPGLTPTETSLLSYTNVHASIGDGLAATIASSSIYGKDHSYSTTKGSRQSRNVSVTIGTSAAARILMSTHTCIQSVGNSRPPVHSGFACKAVDGLFSYRTSNEEVLLGGSLTDAGSLIAWYSTLIGKDRMDVLLNEVEFEYSADVSKLLQEAPYVLPFWSGERSTGWNNNSRGVISGLVHNSSPQQLLIGLMEGVMMRLRVIIMALGVGLNESEKVNEPSVVDAIIGSGAVLEKVFVWRQMLADITNLPVIVLKQVNGEATSNGLALHMLKSEEKTEEYQPIKEDGLPKSRNNLFGFDMNEVEVVCYPISRNHTIYQQRFLLSQRMYEQHSMSSPASTSIENDVNQLLEIEATLKRQQVEMDIERSEIAAARRQLELDLQEAEHKKEKAEEAAQIAEKRRREASAEIMFKKAISRNSLHAAEHKRDEAQAAELLAEERLREAEDKRRLAEEIEFKLQEEIAAMATLKEELDDTMTEPLEFVKNTAELSPSGLQSCLKIIPVLLSNPTLAICIDGHTNCFLDKCKDHCIHVQLSQLRVDAVKEQLTRGGAHNNILTKGWGCKHPELKNKRAVRIYPVPKHAIKLHKMTSL